MEACRTMKEYAMFVAKVKEYLKESEEIFTDAELQKAVAENRTAPRTAWRFLLRAESFSLYTKD